MRTLSATQFSTAWLKITPSFQVHTLQTGLHMSTLKQFSETRAEFSELGVSQPMNLLLSVWRCCVEMFLLLAVVCQRRNTRILASLSLSLFLSKPCVCAVWWVHKVMERPMPRERYALLLLRLLLPVLLGDFPLLRGKKEMACIAWKDAII